MWQATRVEQEAAKLSNPLVTLEILDCTLTPLILAGEHVYLTSFAESVVSWRKDLRPD